MFVAIAIVTSLAWWDEQREADAALRDLETEQSILASSLAAALRARLLLTVPMPEGRGVDPGVVATGLLGGDESIARPGELTVLLSAPRETSLHGIDGRVVTPPPSLRTALDTESHSVRLTRPEAAQVGLPARTAMAGLAYVDAGPLGRWGVAAVATAARERDREKRAMGRLLLGVGVASGLVLLFGGIAFRKQRRELALERELAVAEAQRAGEGALLRAQRIATMGTFAMGIAHEVATPLGVIVGRAEQLVGRAQDDERAVHGAQAILQQADRIQRIVRRFLDMARGGPPSLQEADPSEVARAATSSVEHRFARANVALRTDIPGTMPSIQCDRALLEQALVNLLLNACDACKAGEHVEVAAHADAERVTFVVTDDGVGITDENASRATEPFFTTKPDGQGTGLGLAIAAEIAKSHRGDLTVAHNAERGTRACIEIPIAGRTGGTHS
jgi:signal transduction histidine kinase